MKKFLSLVLALVMTMSLVTISAGAADFDDDGDIDYKEAVDVISALGIVDGYDDDTFRPDGALTRGAAAKIICNLILGPTTASALSATSAPFRDVPTTNVFAGYITFCAQEGIINGYGDGTFRPSGSLTGNAFMKMLLGALGYDASLEGYSGSNWSVQVIKQAIGIGLDDGNDDFVGSRNVTRQEAALYAANMLQATMVEYDSKTTVVVGDVTVDTVPARNDAGNSSRTDGNIFEADGKMQFAERYFSDLKVETGSDDFGRPANVWTLKSDEIGTYPKKSDLVATFTARVNADDIYDAVGKSVYDSLDDGKSDLTVFIDGAKQTVTDIDDYVERNNSTKVNDSGNGMLTEVYVDDDNNVTIVSTKTYVFQAVADYNATRDSVSLTKAGDTNITLSDATLSGEDFDIADIQADDYILVTAVRNGNRYEVKTVDVAEVVTGMVNGYKMNESVTIGADEYEYSVTALKTGDAGASASPVKSTQYTVGQEAAVVLDSYGHIIAVDAAVVADNYVYIAQFAQPSGLHSGNVKAAAFFTDGTNGEISVKSLLGSTNKTYMVTGNGTGNAGWYTYSVNSSDEYSLYAPESKYTEAVANYAYATGTTVMTNGAVSFLSTDNNSTTKADEAKANNSTIVIVNDNDEDVYAYVGVDNLPDIILQSASDGMAAGSANVTLLQSKGYAAYVYVEVTGRASISGSQDDDLVYVLKYDGQFRTTDNEIYYTYKTLEGTSEAIVETDSRLMGSTDVYGVYYKARLDSDERVTSIDELNANDGKFFYQNVASGAIDYSDGVLTLNGTDYTLADGYTITMVTLKAANELNNDKSADYEAQTVTAKELADLLDGYVIDFEAAGRAVDSDRDVIEELYVTVTDVISAPVQGGNQGGGVIGTNSDGNEARWDGAKVKLFYYGDPMTTSEIRTAIANLFGSPVTAYNSVLGSATLESGDIVSVDTTQYQQFAVKVNGTVVDYVTTTSDATSSGFADADDTNEVPAGDYLPKDKLVNGGSDLVTVTDGTAYTPGTLTEDIDLVPAYEVTYSGVTVQYNNSGSMTTIGSSPVKVQEGLQVTVTSAMTTNGKFQQFLVDGQPYGDVYEVVNTTANKIENYEITKAVTFGEKEVFEATLNNGVTNGTSDMSLTWYVNGSAVSAGTVYLSSSDRLTAKVSIGSTGFKFTVGGAKLTATKDASSTADTTASFTYTNEFVSTPPAGGALTFDTNKDVKNTEVTVTFTTPSDNTGVFGVTYTAGTNS